MSVRSRVAFASGAAGLAGAALLLSGRFDGSVVAVLLLLWAARTAPAAALSDAGPLSAQWATRELARHLWLAPTWALVVATAAVRAGSADLADLRGAHAVAGLALARGEPLTVIGQWLALTAGVAAAAGFARVQFETGAPAGAVGRVATPAPLGRLGLAAVAGQVILLTALFAGPEVNGPPELFWWADVAIVLGAVVWLSHQWALGRLVPALTAAAASLGLVLAIVGGAP